MTAVEELAPRTEDEVRAHLAAGKLVEGLQHMSPEYLRGIRRILTVSADTELVSAPAYLRAALHAPALNNYGSAVSIIQDELAHAHRSEEHTSELQSLAYLVCRLLLEKKKNT